MDTQKLNLARKWRSKNFDQIIGQDLSVKMLKNSLYLSHYFPVYLFSGQKGCGKTSTARVFSAAINCDHLVEFQKDPKNTILPCLTCNSCVALMQGRHPDFIEIDAASNTGVDNVRHIIDSSSLLPLMGRKKIYLIDEAHMLSKAAFNAFLKLMEEPPASVIFILATTDTQKIIETVRSRCFQLLFRPVDQNVLLKHLINVCATEGIDSDESALALIVKETGGSIRDALNLLEQVRFSDTRITKQAVYNVLGHLDEARLLSLFEIVLYKTPADFLSFAQEHALEKFSPEFLWHRISGLLRACIWIKHGITPTEFADYTSQLQFLSRGKSLKSLTALLELFYNNESFFRKTSAAYPFLEMLLLRICQKNESNSNSSMPAVASMPVATDLAELEALDETSEEDVSDAPETPAIEEDEEAALWKELLAKIEILKDPLLESIFKQGTLSAYDKQSGSLHIEFPKELTFFSDILESTKPTWQPLMEQFFTINVDIKAAFTKESAVIIPAVSVPVIKKMTLNSTVPVAPVQEKNFKSQNYTSYRPKQNFKAAPLNEKRLEISNPSQWPQAALLLKYFPGTLTQIRETL